MRLSLRLVSERRRDKIGRATILGAEGAPPVITLKLMEWEVRAGALGSHVGQLQWTVKDTETCAVVDEEAVRSVILRAKPDAFISMLQEDKLNYEACELLQVQLEKRSWLLWPLGGDCLHLLSSGRWVVWVKVNGLQLVVGIWPFVTDD